MMKAARFRWLSLSGVACALLLGGLLGAAHVSLVRQPADFSSYYAAARVLAAGGDPYDWHALQQVVPWVIAPGFVYPLWGLLSALAVAWLPLPIAAGVWLAGSCCCLVFAVWTLARLAGIARRSFWLPGLVGLTCLSIPGVFVLIQGQVSLLLLAALVGAYAALRTGRPQWTGLLLALALAKPQLTLLPAAALLFLAWRRHSLTRTATWMGSSLAVLIALSVAVRPRWVAGWLSALAADAGQGGSGARALSANMGTIPALAAHLPPVAGGLLILLAVGSAGWLLVILTRRVTGHNPARAELELLSGAICVGTALSPWMWIYDGVLWLVPLVVLLRWGGGTRRWLGLAAFWALPWAIRLWYVAVASGAGTTLNKLEDVLIAPLLLTLLFVPTVGVRAPRWFEHSVDASDTATTPASASQPATPRAPRSLSASTAESAEPAHRPAVAPRHPSRRA